MVNLLQFLHFEYHCISHNSSHLRGNVFPWSITEEPCWHDEKQTYRNSADSIRFFGCTYTVFGIVATVCTWCGFRIFVLYFGFVVDFDCCPRDKQRACGKCRIFWRRFCCGNSRHQHFCKHLVDNSDCCRTCCCCAYWKETF